MSQAGPVDILAQHPEIPTSFPTDSGTAIPALNELNIFSSVVNNASIPKGIETTGVGNTVTIEVQKSAAIAATDVTKVGLAAFSSNDFNVDANGFVQLKSMAANWTVITASQTLAVDNGYICASPGGALALALPAVSSVGNMIEVTLDGATSFSITQGAGQSIKIGSSVTTTGAGGSLTSTQQGDSIRMVCSVANLRWNVLSSMGNPTIA